VMTRMPKPFLASRALTFRQAPPIASFAACPSKASIRFFSSAEEVTQILQHDNDICKTFHMTADEVDAIWRRVDKNGDFPEVARGDNARTIIRLVLREQEKKVKGVLAAKEELQLNLERLAWLWSMNWNQWGLASQISDNTTAMEAAKCLVKHLEEDSEKMVQHVMDSITWGPLGRQRLISAFQGDQIEEAELDIVKNFEVLDALSKDNEIEETFHLSAEAIDEIWNRVHDSHEFSEVAVGDNAKEILREVLRAQKEKVKQVIDLKERHAQELDAQAWESLSWKQLSEIRKSIDNAEATEAAHLLVRCLDEDLEGMVDHIMASLKEKDCLNRQSLIDALHGDLIKEAEVGEVKADLGS